MCRKVQFRVLVILSILVLIVFNKMVTFVTSAHTSGFKKKKMNKIAKFPLIFLAIAKINTREIGLPYLREIKYERKLVRIPYLGSVSMC